MALAVIGSIIALATHTGDITVGTVDPLSRLIQPDVTSCKAASALGMHGISQARSCDTHSTGIGLLGYQFSTSGAYLAGLARLNILTGFRASGAGTSCPPPSGRTSGHVGWHSNDNPAFRPRTGQVLECYTYGHDSRILIYLWTLPSERTILVANDGATGATYADLDTWWAGLSYG